MSMRYSHAIIIQEGACNTRRIAKALVEALDDCANDEICSNDDPAVRLIVHQLSHLCRITDIDHGLYTYSKLLKLCEVRAKSWHHKQTHLYRKITRPQANRLREKWLHLKNDTLQPAPSFLKFRRSIIPVFGGDGAISVKWCGMWLCIEKDGHSHT